MTKRIFKLRNVVAVAICLAATTAFLSCKKDSNEKKITAFSITAPAAAGVIDEAGKSIAVTVPAGTDVTALVPQITISKKATISPASGTAQNFITPEPIPLRRKTAAASITG